MIDVISAKDLRQLAEVHDERCVSIYLPTHTAGPDTTQDPIRLKNLTSRAMRDLQALGVPAADAERTLAAADALHDDADFWAHQGRGLAVLVAGDTTRTHRLPDAVDELVVVADRLHLKPLLPCVSSGEVFYVLALSQNRVRLLRGSRISMNEIAVDEVPDSVADALRFDDREPQLQSHSAARTGRGDVAATFHGQGAGQDSRDADLDRFLGAVDAGVGELLGDSRPPIVLAGVTDLVARYRRLSGYPHLVDGEIPGNADRTHVHEFHERAWPLVRPLFDAAQQEARDRVLARSVPTSTRVDDVVLAAHDGRVRSLFVPIGIQCWGRFDTERREIVQHDVRQPGDQDLSDIASLETLLTGGNVFAVAPDDLPADGPLVAEFRY